ncbi:MAG TPA: acyl-CoA dehydrogenase [Vicinamibacterales bacterium]|nr:acyl-CoA dehydrogenase [Vicinamibacterales bacterium]
MMNSARLGVGLEGVAIAERAYQQARDFARERIQGRDALRGDGGPVPIIRHPDVRRMLLSMRAQTEAARALAYYAAGMLDRAKHGDDPDRRRRDQARVDLLIPVVKGFCTDIGVEVASTGIQVHGGMGFIEETGAAQHYRDARITPIYEGTNGIQALDLLGRKLLRDRGEAMRALIAEMRALDPELAATRGDDFAAIRSGLAAGVDALAAATDWLLDASRSDPGAATAGATHYMRLTGAAVGGWLMARAALEAARRLAEEADDPGFLQAKLRTARFYAEQILPQGVALLTPIVRGGGTVMEFDEAQF